MHTRGKATNSPKELEFARTLIRTRIHALLLEKSLNRKNRQKCSLAGHLQSFLFFRKRGIWFNSKQGFWIFSKANNADMSVKLTEIRCIEFFRSLYFFISKKQKICWNRLKNGFKTLCWFPSNWHFFAILNTNNFVIRFKTHRNSLYWIFSLSIMILVVKTKNSLKSLKKRLKFDYFWKRRKFVNLCQIFSFIVGKFLILLQFLMFYSFLQKIKLLITIFPRENPKIFWEISWKNL